MNLIHLTDEDPWNLEEQRYDFHYKGMPCLVMRNHSGALCGYVGVTKEHPLYGVHPDHHIFVHGRVTFSEFGDGTAHVDKWFYHAPYDLEGNLVWWIGFHCAHAGDYCPGTAETLRKMGATKEMYEPKQVGQFMEVYRDFDYVLNEVRKLGDQLEKESYF